MKLPWLCYHEYQYYDMKIEDKKEWLDKHGRIEIGPVASSAHMYCVWKPHGSNIEIVKFEEKTNDAIGKVYDEVEVQLFALCQGFS